MVTFTQITDVHRSNVKLIEDLVHVFRSAREEHLRFLMDLHSAEEDRHFLSKMMLPQNHVWLAHIEDAQAGFIAFADGWVNHLYVARQFQGRGAGSGLLRIAQESNLMLQLWVFEGNIPAIKFYEKHGFHIAERTDGAANEAKMPDVRMQWSR